MTFKPCHAPHAVSSHCNLCCGKQPPPEWRQTHLPKKSTGSTVESTGCSASVEKRASFHNDGRQAFPEQRQTHLPRKSTGSTVECTGCRASADARASSLSSSAAASRVSLPVLPAASSWEYFPEASVASLSTAASPPGPRRDRATSAHAAAHARRAAADFSEYRAAVRSLRREVACDWDMGAGAAGAAGPDFWSTPGLDAAWDRVVAAGAGFGGCFAAAFAAGKPMFLEQRADMNLATPTLQ